MASAATIATDGEDKFTLDLINETGTALVIESFSLSAGASTPNGKDWSLASVRVWDDSVALPTGTQALNEGSGSDRTIAGSGRETMEFQFMYSNASEIISFTLVINFVDGSSSTMTFSVDYN